MNATRRITALAILMGLLALPLLGMAAGDACSCGSTPCAPGAAPCESLGPIPCCHADRGVSTAPESGAAALSVAILSPVGWLAVLGNASGEKRLDRSDAAALASALHLSVVLRI